MGGIEGVLDPFLSLAMFATPALLVSAPFPRRSHFEIRVAACLTAVLALFIFWNPAIDLSTSETIPVSEFVSMAVLQLRYVSCWKSRGISFALFSK